jgi:predicted RNA-binding protein with PUA-like domain
VIAKFKLHCNNNDGRRHAVYHRLPSLHRRRAALMQYWLIKSEPDAFSWDEQVANGVEAWTGVRNHSAKLNLQAMRRGDLAFFYHSNIGKAIVGVVEVVREAYPDPTAESGPWVCVDVKAKAPIPEPVTLATIKSDPALADMALVRLSRLSVGPVKPAEWAHICKLGGLAGKLAKP